MTSPLPISSTTRCTRVSPSTPQRPTWARRMDRLVLPLLRLARRLFPRPSEAALAHLSGRTGGHTPSSPASQAAGHIQKGRIAFERGAMGEALHHFGQAIDIDKDARWAWHGRGDALQLSDRPQAALTAYERACELEPACGLHHAGRSNALAKLNQCEASDAAWQQALHLDATLGWMRDPPHEEGH